MPKTPSTRLYNLIKSLSSSEKRYFKVQCGIGENGNSKYILLFDAIDQQEIFDESALIQAVYPDQQIQSRKFSELKSYLFNLILKSLHDYDEQSSIQFKIKGYLLDIKTLFKRSLFDECNYIVQKAKKVASQYELFNNLLELLHWEKKIAYAQMDVDYLNNQIDQIAQEEQACLEKLHQLSVYRRIFFKILISTKKEAILRSSEKISQISRLIEHPLLSDITKAQSYQARVLFYRIFSSYCYSIRNYQTFYENGQLLIEQIESNPRMLKEDVSEYISALSNFIVSCGLTGRYGKVRSSLEKLKEINPKTQDDALKIHRQYYNAKFSLCIFTGAFEEGLEALNEHFAKLHKFDAQLFERIDFYLQYFYIYFGNNDFDKAQIYLTKWLNLPKSIAREDLQSIARILNLILHYEMGHTLLLEHLLRSTYRFFKKRNRLYQFEEKVLQFIRKTESIQSQKNLRQAFIQLKQAFEELAKIPSERIMFQYFDFISWLESRIRNKPFSEVVKEKYEKTMRKQ